MIWKLCALALLAAAVGMLFADTGFKGRRSFLAVAGLLLAVGTVEGLGRIVTEVLGIAETGGAVGIAESAMKVVGTGYVFGISADLCRELDAVGVANALTLAGRVEIVLIILPYFVKTVSLGMELLK